MEREIFEYFRDITQACYAKVDEKLVKYGLVKGQAYLLSLIKENNGCTQKDLANIIGIKYSSMSERIEKLEKLGYAERNIDGENLKYKRVNITPKGKVAAIQCNRILNEFNGKLFKGITKKDQKQLEAYLKKMAENVQ